MGPCLSITASGDLSRGALVVDIGLLLAGLVMLLLPSSLGSAFRNPVPD